MVGSLFILQMTMSLKATICYLFILVSFVYTDDQSSTTNEPGSDPKFDARISELLSKNVLQFAQEIGTMILQDSDKKTEVFSPLSIYSALSMLLMGSNGQTFQELMNVLKVNNGKRPLIWTFYSLFLIFGLIHY